METVMNHNRDGLDFGQRLREILDERKQIFHGDQDEQIVKSIMEKLDVSRRTVYRIISGQRYANPKERKLIADCLGITYERLVMTDTYKDTAQVRSSIQNGAELDQALQIAKGIVEVSLGFSERYEAYKDYGRVLFELRQFEEAHSAWSQSYEFAKSSGVADHIFAACNNLMHTASRLKKFWQVENILHEAEEFVIGDSEKRGRIQYFLGSIFFGYGNYDEALIYFKKSFHFYSQFGNQELIGKALHNIASVHMKIGNYAQAIDLQEQSLSYLIKSSLATRLITIDEYAETLYLHKELTKAEHVVKQALEEIEHSGLTLYENAKSRLLLLQSKIKMVPTYAEIAIELRNDNDVNVSICEFLHDFYLRRGDVIKALYYHERVLDSRNRHRG